MPVNEKILFGSFQYLFSLKTIIYAILLSATVCENHAVLGGKISISEGDGPPGIIDVCKNFNIREKYHLWSFKLIKF
jgi:hypothetical protein